MISLSSLLILIIVSQNTLAAAPVWVTCPMVQEAIKDILPDYICKKSTQEIFDQGPNYVNYLLKKKNKLALVKVVEIATYHDIHHNLVEAKIAEKSATMKYTVKFLGMKEVTLNEKKLSIVVREFGIGGTLESMFKDKAEGLSTKKLAEYRPYEDIMYIFRSLVLSVREVHRAGFALGNLRFENIMVDDDGFLRVLEFGEAWELKKITEPVGYPLYMDPRFFEVNDLRYDEKIDVYSLGVILYRLCTNSFPFSGTSYEEIQAAVKTGKYVIQMHMEVSLALIVTKCLQKHDDKRIDMAELLRLVNNYLFKDRDTSIKQLEVSSRSSYTEANFQTTATNKKDPIDMRNQDLRRSLMLADNRAQTSPAVDGPSFNLSLVLGVSLAVAILSTIVRAFTLWFIRARKESDAKMSTPLDEDAAPQSPSTLASEPANVSPPIECCLNQK